MLKDTAYLLSAGGLIRALIWERWRKGETLHQIARLFDRYHSSIQASWLSPVGYARPSDTGQDRR